MLVAFSVVIMATVVAVAATVTAETMATATLSDAGGGGEVEEAVTSKTLSVLVDIQRVGLTEGVKLTWDNL